MNSNIKIFLLCPVPEEQKPINEYIGLKENPLTNWTTLSKTNYQKKIFSFSFFLFFFLSLIRFQELFQYLFSENSIGQQILSFNELLIFLEWVLINILITLFLVFVFITINYSRWKQIQIRFNNPRLFYEEASWYDGQIWEKPFAIIKNDRLISTQKVQPILQRIGRTSFTLFFINMICLLFFQLL